MDVPHLRSIESASCGDFDMLVGRALAGAQALVVTGFDIANPVAAIGSAATGMQLNVANSILINLNASESGSMFWQSTGTNPAVLNPVTNTKVQGSFTPSTYNYIGLDLSRTADTATSDLVEFLDPNTDLENPEIVPLARTLSYVIVISTATFASQPNLVPIAIVLTDSSNNVSTLQDARNLYGRLGLGGDSPNAAFQYTWPQGRAEDTDTNVFQGGDKAIGSQKDWMNATMSRIWEVGGGEYWYSRAADRNVTMVASGTPLVSDSLYFDYTGGILTWTGLTFLFDNSSNTGVYYNDIENNTGPGKAMADGECLYVILDRSANHVRGVNGLVMQGPVALNTVGSGINYADLQIVVWVEGGFAYARGQQTNTNTPVPPATTTTLGIVKLFQTPASAPAPVVLNLGVNRTLTWTATATTGVTGFTALTLTGGDTDSGHVGGAGVSGTGGLTVLSAEGAPGVSGTGGPNSASSSQAGPGVYGQGGPSASTTTKGGRGGHFLGAGTTTGINAGDGIEVVGGAATGVAQAAGNAIRATGGAADTAGGVAGPGLLVYAGTASGGATASAAIVAHSGNVQCDAADDFAYNSTKFYWLTIGASDMVAVVPSAANFLGGPGIENQWSSVPSTATNIQIPLKGFPAGATITAVYLTYGNTNTGNQTWMYTTDVWGPAGPGTILTQTKYNNSTNFTASLSTAKGITGLPSFTSFTIPAQTVSATGYSNLYITWPSLGSGASYIFNVQIEYSTTTNPACYG